MSTQEIASSQNLQELSTTYENGRYTLWQIPVIWLAASAPINKRAASAAAKRSKVGQSRTDSMQEAKRKFVRPTSTSQA